tara:strand:- start:3987 stop:4526 length:540 start_codon:yes stop_codon:yes gene_type:complete
MINLLIIDVDGVLTDGRKVYDKSHKVLSKKYLCKDFTAIKRFVAAGIKVVMLSGDNFNKEMTQKRNIDFYCTRDLNLSLDKSQFLQIFEEKYNVPIENMAFVGDDYFDLTIIKKLDYTFCPSDSPKIVKDECEVVLKSVGGDGVIVELYDVLVNKYFNEPSLNDVLELDKKEISSEEMC